MSVCRKSGDLRKVKIENRLIFFKYGSIVCNFVALNRGKKKKKKKPLTEKPFTLDGIEPARISVMRPMALDLQLNSS